MSEDVILPLWQSVQQDQDSWSWRAVSRSETGEQLQVGSITHQTFDSAHSRFPHSWLILRAFLSETRVVVTNPTDEFSMLTRLTCCKMKKIKINVKNGHIFTPGFSLGLLKRHSRAAWHLWTLFYSTIYLQFTALSTCLLWDIIKQRDE